MTSCRQSTGPALAHDLVRRCVGSDGADQVACLREAALALGLGSPQRRQFETMLDCHACESAVLLLLPPDARFMLSRGGREGAMASIVPAPAGEEVTMEAATPALALLAAYAAALVAEGGLGPIVPRSERPLPSMRVH